jgi:pimeloyl-ACP methyl ester carboxylesterase
MAVATKAPGPDLRSQPEVQMERPLLFVPGFQSKEGCFDEMTAQLTAGGANGGRTYYVDGFGVFLDAECRQPAPSVPPEARVFVTALGPNRDAPPVVASVLARALDHITEICGQKVDVTGYSMGGLATRLYLDRGGQAVGKFMMVGTPNHGSPLADLGMGLLDRQVAGKAGAWLLHQGPKPLSQQDRSALTWLTPDTRPDRSPGLEELNSRWSRQRASVEEVEVVGSKNLTTLSFDFKPGRGDGTVPEASLAPSSDTPVVFLDDKDHARHGQLLQSAALHQEMTRFFGWQPVSRS